MAKLELLAGERQEGERNKAVQACNDYLRLGPGRSLAKLLRRYQIGPEAPPTKRLNTLKDWSTSFDWQARAVAYDADIERQKNEYVQQIMKSGLALAHERVTKLKTLAEHLEKELYRRKDGQIVGFRRKNVWVPDKKMIGKGEAAEPVDIVRFNPALFDEYRGTMDDLARETGGRRQRRENLNIDYSKLTDDELDRIAAGEDVLDVILSRSSRGGA